MQISELHEWDLTPAEARQLQKELADQIELRPLPPCPEFLAGADVAFDRELDMVFAAVIVFAYPELEPVEQATARQTAPFPYVPGLLSFREAPVVLDAFRKLRHEPDVVFFDGQGYAHPRRLGLASHIGLWLRRPTVGCAKSRLIGEHEEPGLRRGQAMPLRDGGEQIGVVLRTREGVSPIFVSPGHLADFATSRSMVLDCCQGYRLPEPTRLAHTAVGRFKQQFLRRRG
ncbi:MAG: deoxyribonuclease V [Planctomycetota bacterium]|jgi:deoxyribonuclease V